MFESRKFFEDCVCGIIKQGRKCRTKPGGSCVYRNRDGDRCVIGQAIPESLYVKDMDDEEAVKAAAEGFDATDAIGHSCVRMPSLYADGNLIVLRAIASQYGSPITDVDLNMMREMQSVHDGFSAADGEDLNRWANEFDRIRNEFFPSPETQTGDAEPCAVNAETVS